MWLPDSYYRLMVLYVKKIHCPLESVIYASLPELCQASGHSSGRHLYLLLTHSNSHSLCISKSPLLSLGDSASLGSRWASCSWQQAISLYHFPCTRRTTEQEQELLLLPGCVHTGWPEGSAVQGSTPREGRSREAVLLCPDTFLFLALLIGWGSD